MDWPSLATWLARDVHHHQPDRSSQHRYHFGAAAAKLAQQGNVLPTRLDGLKSVGPLKSLAGARPHDDVTVKLEGVVTDKELSTESPPDGEGIPSHRATPNSDHRSMERFSEHS